MKSPLLCCLGLLLVTGICSAGRAPTAARSHSDPSAPGYSWPAADVDGDGVFDRLDRCPGTPSGATVDQCGCPLPDPNWPAVRAAAAYPPGPSAGMRTDLLRTGFIRLDMAFFRTDRAVLRPRAKRALRDVADLLRAYPTLKFEVAGHADARGTEVHNQALSERRAREVRRFLIEDGRVRDIQLVARGYGESRPATAERDGRELQANRRVELRLLNPEAMPRGSRIETPGALEALASQSSSHRRGELMASRQR